MCKITCTDNMNKPLRLCKYVHVCLINENLSFILRSIDQHKDCYHYQYIKAKKKNQKKNRSSMCMKQEM